MEVFLEAISKIEGIFTVAYRDILIFVLYICFGQKKDDRNQKESKENKQGYILHKLLLI